MKGGDSMHQEYLTIREVAQKLGISESTIRGYCRKGLIYPKRDAARNWRWFSKEDVEKIIAKTSPR
jgi:DNA-binding transcriptional MerR regulator